MRILISGIILTVAAMAGFAQGTIEFNNFRSGLLRAPIYGYDGSSQRGNPPNGIPAGTTIYGGALLAGTGFSVQVFGGSTSTSEGALVAASAVLNFRTGAAAGFIDNPSGLIATVPGVAEGESAIIQLRAWDNQGGTISTWDQVVASPIGTFFGTSAMFVSQPLGGAFTDPPLMLGLTSFNIGVPEPSTVALGILGLGALLFLRRK